MLHGRTNFEQQHIFSKDDWFIGNVHNLYGAVLDHAQLRFWPVSIFILLPGFNSNHSVFRNVNMLGEVLSWQNYFDGFAFDHCRVPLLRGFDNTGFNPGLDCDNSLLISVAQ